ncbi:sensor histidine kinase [Paenibacillus psychroresistens]|nr:histidine kinase [Paenibacillus psychroresistens]
MSNIKDFLLQLVLISTVIFTYQIFFAERSESNNKVKIVLSLLLGLSIVLCMSFPTIIANGRLDIRIVPLLLGTLYGGWRTGIFLSVIIILYRAYLGGGSGLYSTTLTLLISMPVIIYYQKRFINAMKQNRIYMSLILCFYYCMVGICTVAIIRGFSFKVFQVQLVYIVITVVSVLFFIFLNETINEMLRKNRQLQSDAKDAEIAFLRSQIKPHFLYNTLNSIASLCIDAPNKAEELTLDLSQYLRSSFNFKQLDSLTTIENELALINAYINIEKARFGARLGVEFDVDANLDFEIPSLILQPLVENAIRHGLMSSLQGGTVKISIKRRDDTVLSFSVEDNGGGMSETKREEILKPDINKKGVGLWNISQRIKLLYGNNLRIESAEGVGTKVFFEIPVLLNRQIGG